MNADPASPPAADTPRPISRRLWLAAGALLLVAAAFRVLWLDNIPGFNGDEALFGAYSIEGELGRTHPWWTPTGVFVNPVFWAELRLLHALHPEPAVWLLRVTSALDGLLVMLLAYPLLRRPLGARPALAATVLLAASPVCISYSRICWMPSQIPLVTLLCVALTLQGRYVLATLAFLYAPIAHPTAIFIAPVLAGILAPRAIQHLAALPPAQRRRTLKRAAALGAAAVVVIGVALALAGPRWLRLPWTKIGEHAIDLPGYARFALLYGRLLSGAVMYDCLSGPLPPLLTLLHDALFWSLAALLLVIGGRRLVRDSRWSEVGMAAGLAVSLMIFYLIAGTDIIAGGTERYALFCIVPSYLLAAACLGRFETVPIAGRWALPGALAVAGCMLLTFHGRYFEAFHRTGGLGHGAHRTGPVDPKVAAGRTILEATRGGRAIVIAESWWAYWPLRYILARHAEIRVCQWSELGRMAYAPGERFFAVGFLDQYGITRQRLERPEAARFVLQRWTLADYAGRGAVGVWELAPPHGSSGTPP